jgi:hypothetical protein
MEKLNGFMKEIKVQAVLFGLDDSEEGMDWFTIYLKDENTPFPTQYETNLQNFEMANATKSFMNNFVFTKELKQKINISKKLHGFLMGLNEELGITQLKHDSYNRNVQLKVDEALQNVICLGMYSNFNLRKIIVCLIEEKEEIVNLGKKYMKKLKNKDLIAKISNRPENLNAQIRLMTDRKKEMSVSKNNLLKELSNDLTTIEYLRNVSQHRDSLKVVTIDYKNKSKAWNLIEQEVPRNEERFRREILIQEGGITLEDITEYARYCGWINARDYILNYDLNTMRMTTSNERGEVMEETLSFLNLSQLVDLTKFKVDFEKLVCERFSIQFNETTRKKLIIYMKLSGWLSHLPNSITSFENDNFILENGETLKMSYGDKRRLFGYIIEYINPARLPFILGLVEKKVEREEVFEIKNRLELDDKYLNGKFTGNARYKTIQNIINSGKIAIVLVKRYNTGELDYEITEKESTPLNTPESICAMLSNNEVDDEEDD